MPWWQIFLGSSCSNIYKLFPAISTHITYHRIFLWINLTSWSVLLALGFKCICPVLIAFNYWHFFINMQNRIGFVYSPSPEYPAVCRSGAEIPPSGAAVMKGEVNRAEAHQSEGGLIPLYHFNVAMATTQFRFDIPQVAAGSFIKYLSYCYYTI